MQEVLTTQQVADKLHVSVKMVREWIDEGMMYGFLIPKTNHRRVHVDEVARFASVHGLYVTEGNRILLVGRGTATVEGADVRGCEGLVEAGGLIASWKPMVVVCCGGRDMLRELAGLKGVVLAAYCGDDLVDDALKNYTVVIRECQGWKAMEEALAVEVARQRIGRAAQWLVKHGRQNGKDATQTGRSM